MSKAVWLKGLGYTTGLLVTMVAGTLVYLSQPSVVVVPPAYAQQQAVIPASVPHLSHRSPYAASEWPTVHGSASNNDYVPVKQGLEFEHKWYALRGMSTAVAPTTGVDGNLYQTTGNAPGQSNLFALNRDDGSIVWQTPPWQDKDDFDSCAALNAPIVDEQGDLYVSDCNQFWAFKPDGQVKWVIELPAPAPGSAYQDIDEDVLIVDPENPSQHKTVKRLTPIRSFVTAFFTADGSVGGVTVFGDLVIVDRETGDAVAEPFRIPGAKPPGTKPPATDRFLLGLMDGRMIQPLFDLIFGRTFNSSNTPSINPRDGRIFVTATGREKNTGALYGLDFTPADKVGELGRVSVATESVIGKESGSSPSISPDGEQVYLTDDTGKLYAIDTRSGAVKCSSVDIGAQPGSPSIGRDGSVLMLTKTGASSLNSNDCSVNWHLDLAWLRDRELPENLELLLGERFISGSGIIAVTDSSIIVPMALGYDFSLLGKKIPLTVKYVYFQAHPGTGELLAGSEPYFASDSNDAWVVPLKDGQMVFDNGAMLTSISALLAPVVNPILALQGLSLLSPKGGLESIQSVRYADPLNKLALTPYGAFR